MPPYGCRAALLCRRLDFQTAFVCCLCGFVLGWQFRGSRCRLKGDCLAGQTRSVCLFGNGWERRMLADLLGVVAGLLRQAVILSVTDLETRRLAECAARVAAAEDGGLGMVGVRRTACGVVDIRLVAGFLSVGPVFRMAWGEDTWTNCSNGRSGFWRRWRTGYSS